MIARLALAGLTLAAALHAASAAEPAGAGKPEEPASVEAAPADPAKAKVSGRKRSEPKASVAPKPTVADAASSAPEPVAAAVEPAEAEAKPKPASRRSARAAKADKVEAQAAATEPVEPAAATVEPTAPAPVEAKVEPEPRKRGKRAGKGKPGKAETAKAEEDAPAEAVPAETAVVAPTSGRDALDTLIAAHAKANGLPASLVHRVVKIESRYNPKAIGRGGVYGLMQIKTPTARSLGYAGGPAGLLEPDTNLTYGVRYLAGAYKVAGGNETRAYSFYRSGYYYAAKRKGLSKDQPGTVEVASAEPPPEAASRSSLWTPESSAAIDPAR